MSRRQLNLGQKAIISAGWDGLSHGQHEESHPQDDSPTLKKARASRAERAGVSVPTQEKADLVMSWGDKSIIQSVLLGKVSLNDAAASVQKAKNAKTAAENARKARELRERQEAAEREAVELARQERAAAEREAAERKAAAEAAEREAVERARQERAAAEAAEREAVELARQERAAAEREAAERKAAAEAAEREAVERARQERAAAEAAEAAKVAVAEAAARELAELEAAERKATVISEAAEAVLERGYQEERPKIESDILGSAVRNLDREVKVEKLDAANTVLATGAQLYSVILADPPWKYDFSRSETRAIENQYPTMELEDIKSLPLSDLTGDAAVLYLWATAPKLPEALAVMDAWGFTYKTNMVWVKHNIGMGYWARGRHELILIGTKGDFPAPEAAERPDSVIEARRGQHSAKPDEVYEILERLYPGMARLEMFARSNRDGWQSWGSECNTTGSETN